MIDRKPYRPDLVRVHLRGLNHVHNAESWLFSRLFTLERQDRAVRENFVSNEQRNLRMIYTLAKDEQTQWREKAIEEINEVFRPGDLIRIWFAEGWSEVRRFKECYDWHVYTDDGCVCGHPLVSIAVIEKGDLA